LDLANTSQKKQIRVENSRTMDWREPDTRRWAVTDLPWLSVDTLIRTSDFSLNTVLMAWIQQQSAVIKRGRDCLGSTKKGTCSQVWRLTSLIPALRNQRQAELWEFQASWSYTVRPWLKRKGGREGGSEGARERGSEGDPCCEHYLTSHHLVTVSSNQLLCNWDPRVQTTFILLSSGLRT
jgi:hypothetical protein